MRYFLCGTVKKGKTSHQKIQELHGEKPYGVAWSCQLQHSRQRRRLFLLEGNKVQILSLQAFPGLFSSFHYYFAAASAIVFVNTVGRTLQPVGDSVNWDLPCEYWCFGELCPGSLGRAWHSEWHFILCIVISFAAEFKSVIAFVVWGRNKH